MEVERYTEELVLLKKEMMGFMSFYKDSILPSILEQKTQLQASLSGISYVFPWRITFFTFVVFVLLNY